MLIEVLQTFGVTPGPTLVSFRSGVGTAIACWHGEPNPTPGPYHIEWTLTDGFAWRQNMQPASSPTAAVAQEGHNIMVRGRLNDVTDDTAVLDLAGSPILLELAAPPPPEITGTWVELRMHQEHAELYPYTL